MSHKKKGHMVSSKEWAKHLRKYWRRQYWRTHRMYDKRQYKKAKQKLDTDY